MLQIPIKGLIFFSITMAEILKKYLCVCFLNSILSDNRQNTTLKPINLYSKQLACMSPVMRKPDFCICQNKDADQLRGNREADQRLCFRYTDSTTRTIPVLPKSEISQGGYTWELLLLFYVVSIMLDFLTSFLYLHAVNVTNTYQRSDFLLEKNIQCNKGRNFEKSEECKCFFHDFLLAKIEYDQCLVCH